MSRPFMAAGRALALLLLVVLVAQTGMPVSESAARAQRAPAEPRTQVEALSRHLPAAPAAMAWETADLDDQLSVAQRRALAVEAAAERAAADRAAADRAAAAAKAAAAKKAAASQQAAPRAPTYSGRNRLWIPELGINRSVYVYSCDRTRTPDNLVYRWGCAGTNNVWLLGHAWGVFKPLHDAYVRGTLHKGMLAVYADSRGRITRYRVTTWRVVTPDVIDWIASQPVPTMHLQTCVGGTAYRLNVRLVKVTS